MHECMNEMMMPRLSWAPPTQVHKHQIPGILALGLVLRLNPKPSKQLWKIIRRFRAVRISCRYENHDSSQQQLQKFIVRVEKGHLLYTLPTAGNPAKCTKFHSNFVCLLPSSSQFETEIVRVHRLRRLIWRLLATTINVGSSKQNGYEWIQQIQITTGMLQGCGTKLPRDFMPLRFFLEGFRQ
jgi:hypothetical protein